MLSMVDFFRENPLALQSVSHNFQPKMLIDYIKLVKIIY